MGYYTGKIKVVGSGFMCFPVHATTLKPLSCGCYDPYAYSDPDKDAVETISYQEWERRQGSFTPRQQRDYYASKNDR